MKFGKEFTSKMVPEWHEAYMDYNFLKSLLKEIYFFKQRKKAAVSSKPKRTLHRAFSGLLHLSKSPGNISSPDIENQAILVNSVSRDGEEKYETTFLKAEDEGAEYELVYFRKLDEELNKSVQFYRAKVEEVMEEAGVLNKQMDALIAFRIKVNNPQAMLDSAAEIDILASVVAASTAEITASTPSAAITRSVPMVTILEDMSNHVWKSNESIDDKETLEAKSMSQDVRQHKPKNIINGIRPAQLEILNYVKVNNTTETPRSTIKGILNITSNETELRFNKQNLRKVELQLKRVLIQFYHKLRLLKSYRFLNTMAFSKIMKKYDKITSRSASKSYLKIVGKSCIGNPDEITKLMERVEVTFIKHFCNSNRDEAMVTLRPKAKKERHRVTFSTGFFVGCVLALILALVLIIRARNIIASRGTDQYMRTLFPLYSLFGFIILHMLMYAANIYFWRRYRVNYTFINGFKEGTELGYREVLFLSFGFSVLAVASVLANLDMDMDPITGDFKAFTELLPLGLLVVVVVILICPLNIIYRSSRFFLLTCVFHSICAPLYMVSFSDSFLADQLTSEVQAIRSLEYYICYYGWGDYKVRRDNCRTSDVFNTFYFIVAAIPYWLRLLQCLRRLCEEKHGMQALNGLKYFSTIIAISARTAFSLNRGSHWRIIAWITSALAAVFGTYWDLVMDWGLLQRNSRNSWLRDKLLLPHKSIYFGAMVLNILLRLAWMETVLGLPTPFLHRETLTVFVAILEIIRRGIWNFFRLENEHLHNVGKYCAIKSVPLPFNCDEDDIKDG